MVVKGQPGKNLLPCIKSSVTASTRAQKNRLAQLLIRQEMERTLTKVELKTIAAKRVNAKYQMDADSEVC